MRAELTDGVIWHDLECGAYREDIALWLGLAAERGGPILDVGAGTGRVAIELARAGHEVVALDRDGELLAELARRADSLPVRCVAADARSFSLPERFRLCLVPMQTIQLFGGRENRRRFLACAREHLTEDGTLAAAVTDQLELFEVPEGQAGPLPDMRELNGIVYCSRPTAVRASGERFILERRRETVAPAGDLRVEPNRIELDALGARSLEREGLEAGFRSDGIRHIAPTRDHVGSQVVVLRV